MRHGPPSTGEIERVLGADPARPGLTVREVTQELGLPAAARPVIRRLLRRMVTEGRLVVMRGRRFGVRALLGDLVGRFTRRPEGYGFVVPDDPTEEDLYVPPEAQAGALHGDLVAASVVSVRRDGKREGRIVRVVERASSRVAGMFYETASGGGIVQPLDAGYGFEVLVPRGRTEDARTGEIVRVELSVFPGEAAAAKGAVVERLGRPDEPGVDVELLIRKYGLSPEFPDAVLEEVDALPGDPEQWPLAARDDFSGDLVVTIDGETARDFDDAFSVRRLPDGGFRLNVHIADVAFFVPEGSATDQEALRRGTSVYFPGRAIPMLPERLSNDLCSLRPEEVRLTQGVALDYDRQGRLAGARFHDGFIRSRARLTYTEAALVIEQREPEARRRREALLPMLDAAAELARLLAANRRRRGAIDFDLPEPEILLDLTGETLDIVSRPRNDAHRLIEEFMIAANEAVATELIRRRAPTLHRAHERPDPVRVARLALVLDGLGYSVPSPYTSIRPGDFAALVDMARGRPEAPFVNRLVLRTMSLARYDPQSLGHFGLALRRYLHFTSPIRRYPDLVSHRALRQARAGVHESPGERADRVARLPELGRECSRLEREAEAAERESVAWKMASFMADRLGDEFESRVVEVAPYGVLVALGEPPVEGLVHVSRLGAEFFRYDAGKQTLRGAESGAVFRLGQELRVRVERVDAMKHQVDFAPVRPTVAEKPPAALRAHAGRRRKTTRRRGAGGRGRRR